MFKTNKFAFDRIQFIFEQALLILKKGKMCFQSLYFHIDEFGPQTLKNLWI